MNSFLARAQIESIVASRFPSAFTQSQRSALETITTGITEFDRVVGGIGRGAITELCGSDSSGRSSLLLSVLAGLTRQPEVCALVDACDAFHPPSAAAAGVDLKQLLWVRCQNQSRAVDRTLEQSLKVTDLLLQSGGFSLVVLDLADFPPQRVRRIPLHCWFRFRQAVENTPAALLVLGRESYAKTSASLVFELQQLQARWESPLATLDSAQPLRTMPSHACLLQGLQMEIKVKRSRQGSALTQHRSSGLIIPAFETRSVWMALDPAG